MKRQAWETAFTLVEMSFVLVIVGLVLSLVFPALKSVREATQNSATHSHLDELVNATAAYVQAHGCMPCPTPAGTMGVGFGRVRGDMNAPLCGACSQAEGIVPFASMGLPIHMAKDGWGRWITMRVDPALTTAFGVVPPFSACLSSDPLPCVRGESRKGMCQAGLSSANRIIVRTPGGADTQAAVIFVSHGKNGRGAYYAGAVESAGSNHHPAMEGSSCSALGGFERCNADGDVVFVNASYTTDPLAVFDDHLRFLDRNALVSTFGNGACHTQW